MPKLFFPLPVGVGTIILIVLSIICVFMSPAVTVRHSLGLTERWT